MIGILGGTFDPIHYGHLRTARDLLVQLPLEQVRFIPCGKPPHRESPVASAEQRLAMVQAATRDEPRFVVDEREIRRAGPSYMVDTLSSLRQELGAGQSIGLILGLDAFLGLEGWHRWQAIIGLAHILVMTRPGYTGREIPSPGLQALLKQHQTDDREDCIKQPAGRVLFCRVTEQAISATDIRQKIRQAEDVSRLLPAAVLEMINQQQIYSQVVGRNDGN